MSPWKCYFTFITIFNMTGENIRLNHIKLPTFDFFFYIQKWQVHMVKSNRYEREHKAGDFNWLIVKKKKKHQISVWGWSSHPSLVCRTLAICRAERLPSWLPATTCYFDNCSFWATRTICKTLGTYRKLRGSRAPTCSDQRAPQHSPPSNGASGLQGNHIMFRTQSQSWPAPPGFQPLFHLYLESFRKLVQKDCQASFILGFSISLKNFLKTRENSVSLMLKFN